MIDSVAALRDRLDRARVASDVECFGEDSSSLLRVFLGASGNPQRVAVATKWRGGAPELAEALRGALRAATMARITAWAQAFNDDDSLARTKAASPSRKPRDGFRTSVHDLPPLSPLLREARTALAEVAQRVRSEPPKGIGRDTGRHIVLTVSNGDLIELRIDPQWLSCASPGALGRALHQALAAAFKEQQRCPAQAIGSVPALREIRRIAEGLSR
ncbi:MAG TPA: hypothetical protein VFC19_15455 [Candidatus Limnocylindrales bacterium]|nr:hypothetical protein [Candidatus Limnocylindrales bacterium]